MILYIENPKRIHKIKRLLELINEFDKLQNTRPMFKISTFLFTSYEQSKKEMKEIPFTIASKNT